MLDSLQTIGSIIFTTSFGFSILRVTTPILFAAMGAVVADRAGVNNMGLEGIMLSSALASVLFSYYSGSVFVGVLGAILIGVLLALLMAYFSLNLKTNLTLTGIALNLMASGGTIFVLYMLTGQKGTSDALPSGMVPSIDLPLIKDIPVVGAIFSGHNLLTYLAFLSVLFMWIFLYKTKLGLRIRSVGENPNAAASVGISVNKVRYIALLMSGLLAGLGGAFMSMGYVNFFSKDMTAARGFIALAAKAMGRATPIGTMLSSILFGVADSLSNNLQILRIPPEFIKMLPYLATILGLIFYALHDRAVLKRKLAGKQSKKTQ